MTQGWPLIGPSYTIDGFVEPMVWGASTYTVIRMPEGLVEAARAAGTRRVGGELEGTRVNFALTRAPVIADSFVWAGGSLLRRLSLEAGDPVQGLLAPVDPDFVLVPEDVTAELKVRGCAGTWAALSPPARRRRLVPVESAVKPATRERRIAELIDDLATGIRFDS